MYDIAIVGLGPAGATLAAGLSPRYRVIAVDRSRPKCCGGLLAPDAQHALAEQGLALPRDVLVSPQIFAVRTIDFRRKQERYYRRSYLNMNRSRFDNWLRSKIPASIEVRGSAICTGIRREDGGFALDIRQAGKTETLFTRIVVGADGADSVVRRRLFGGSIRRYVAMQEWFRAGDGQPFYTSAFDPSVTDCYCWTIHKDDSLIIGAALPEENCRERFALLKEKLRRRGFSFGEPFRRESCFVLRPVGFGSFRVADSGAFLCGEAAGFISPSSLEGISYALSSGHMLAGALNHGLDGAENRYRAATRGIRVGLLAKLLKVPFMYHPALRAAVMASGISSMNIFR